jgi:hypothetical protein
MKEVWDKCDVIQADHAFGKLLERIKDGKLRIALLEQFELAVVAAARA